MILLQQFEPYIAQAAINEYQNELELYRRFTRELDEIARPIAERMLLDEMENVGKGRYGTKVSLAPAAETMKVIKAMEVFELNKVLIESQHQPLSRKVLVEAADPYNAEEILTESVGV
jgi:hypothetical protein